ncbi:MAG: hypothetical protein WCT30_00520 [Desulfurivibrionaceae bacterium]|jgi:hypothetical protein
MKKIQLKPEKRHNPQLCNCSAVPQMRERGLQAIAGLCEQADDKADAVLLSSYRP